VQVAVEAPKRSAGGQGSVRCSPMRPHRVANPFSVSLFLASLRQRSVQCYDTSVDPTFQTPVRDDLCVLMKPSSMQACNTQACPSTSKYQWLASWWSRCSGTCSSGGGTTTRRVFCVRITGWFPFPAPDSACSGSGAKPATSMTCSLNGCASYAMMVSEDWSACSASCGGGVQSRSKSCMESTSMASVDPSFCSAGSTDTMETQACNTQACDMSAGIWAPGDWSACSVACGGGVRNRDVPCKDADGNVVDITLCADAGPAPMLQESCSTQAVSCSYRVLHHRLTSSASFPLMPCAFVRFLSHCSAVRIGGLAIGQRALKHAASAVALRRAACTVCLPEPIRPRPHH
jgi:hypothetical protein